VPDEAAEPQIVHVPGLVHERQIGTPKVTTSATWTWLVEGYRLALNRLHEAVGQRDPKETFIPLFETLNWAVVLIDYGKERGPSLDGEILLGLRCARNRVHHQWADAVEPRDVPWAQGLQATGKSRVIPPAVVLDWFWKPLDLLPDPDEGRSNKDQDEAYSKCLAEQPVRLALEHLESLLGHPQKDELACSAASCRGHREPSSSTGNI
jgi:hypothetical protein